MKSPEVRFFTNTPDNPSNPTKMLAKLVRDVKGHAVVFKSTSKEIPGYTGVHMSPKAQEEFDKHASKPEYDALWKATRGIKAMNPPDVSKCDWDEATKEKVKEHFYSQTKTGTGTMTEGEIWKLMIDLVNHAE